MTEKKVKAKELHEALQHIKALIFDEAEFFDGSGNVREIAREAVIVFEEGEAHEAVLKLKSEITHLQTLIFKDELTGVLNRKGITEEFGALFEEVLAEKEGRHIRQSVVIADFSVIFLDLDNFKKINDTYGHEEGDRVLREVSHILTEHIRHLDAVGRLGGEEFVIALLGANEEEAFSKAEEIRKALMEHIFINHSVPLTASLGVASLKHSNAKNLSELISFADKAMYEAKHNRGKNNTVKYSELPTTP